MSKAWSSGSGKQGDLIYMCQTAITESLVVPSCLVQDSVAEEDCFLQWNSLRQWSKVRSVCEFCGSTHTCMPSHEDPFSMCLFSDFPFSRLLFPLLPSFFLSGRQPLH